MTMPNHEPLTPEQLFALCESNARAIEALANAVAGGSGAEYYRVGRNPRHYEAGLSSGGGGKSSTLANIDRVERTVETLAQSVDRYFAGQANQNRLVSGALEGHETPNHSARGRSNAMSSSGNKTHAERCLETLIELVDLARKQQATGFEETKASIDALALNIGQLAQQQKQTAANLDKVGGHIDKLGDRIDRLAAAIERQNAAIDGHLRLSEAQSVNIAELTRLATKLIDRAA